MVSLGPDTPAPAEHPLSVGNLLPVALPSLLVAMVLAMVSRNAIVSDTWNALVSGREIAANGLPSVEHLTRIPAGRPWVDQQWLAQLILYGLERVGGVGLAVAGALAAATAAYAIAAYAAYSRGASAIAILFGVVAGFAAAPWAVQVRTQALALPLFALALAFIARDPRLAHRSTLLLIPILVLWANVHGSVVLGAGLVFAYAIHSIVFDSVSQLRAALLVAAPITVFVSPYGLSLPGYYRTMLFDPPFARLIAEWHRTTPSAVTAPFFLLAVLCVLVMIVRRSRVTTVDALIVVLTLVDALLAIRMTVWFALTAIVILPPLLTTNRHLRFRGAVASLLAAAAAIGILGALMVTAVRSYTYRPGDSGLAVINRESVGRNVFADLDVADWLLWKLPELRGRMAYDARAEILTRSQFNAVADVELQRPGWRTTLRGYGLVVTRRTAAHHMLAGRSGWHSVYVDSELAILERLPSRD